MIIEVDCNCDTIRIDEEEISIKHIGPNQLVEILEKILDKIDSNFGSEHVSIDVQLNRIDEDSRKTIGEW